jgi:hypothetical protein
MRTHDVVTRARPARADYLAMALAIAALNRHEVSRVVLTRPAVEAGEKLGFLPGSMAEKVNPYLRPLYDALNDMMPMEKASRLIERGVIEVAPLAFMRGRTLNDSIVILDEAQNTTSEQMKMLLTRLGFDSKAVITGDVTQIDLPNDQRSGLIEAIEILTGVEGIMEFTEQDVVRHPLVQSSSGRRAHARRARGPDGSGPGGRRRPMSVRLAGPAARSGLPRVDRALLRHRARRILAALAREDAELSIALVDDAAIQALNQRHRGRPRPTDVLAFSLLEGAHSERRGALLATS